MAWHEVWRSDDADIVAEMNGTTVRLREPGDEDDADGYAIDRHATYWIVEEIRALLAAVEAAAARAEETPS